MPLLRLKATRSIQIMDDFISKFDPTEQVDVEWFQHMVKVAEDIAKYNFITEANKNPMGAILEDGSMLTWPQIHSVLGLKYAKAVLNKTAWIPA